MIELYDATNRLYTSKDLLFFFYLTKNSRLFFVPLFGKEPSSAMVSKIIFKLYTQFHIV